MFFDFPCGDCTGNVQILCKHKRRQREDKLGKSEMSLLSGDFEGAKFLENSEKYFSENYFSNNFVSEGESLFLLYLGPRSF